jgi:hypothetical protein
MKLHMCSPLVALSMQSATGKGSICRLSGPQYFISLMDDGQDYDIESGIHHLAMQHGIYWL